MGVQEGQTIEWGTPPTLQSLEPPLMVSKWDRVHKLVMASAECQNDAFGPSLLGGVLTSNWCVGVLLSTDTPSYHLAVTEITIQSTHHLQPVCMACHLTFYARIGRCAGASYPPKPMMQTPPIFIPLRPLLPFPPPFLQSINQFI